MSDAKTNTGVPAVEVEVVPVEMYVEPISGKRFKSRAAAERHGVKMRLEQKLQSMKEERATKWGEVLGVSNLLECVRSVVENQLEAWELSNGLTEKGNRPCWMSGQVQRCALIPGMLAVEVSFWLQVERYRSFKNMFVEFTFEELLGVKSKAPMWFGDGFSTLKGTESIGISFVRGRKGKDSQSGKQEEMFVLRMHLLLADHPLLAEGVRKALEVVTSQRSRLRDLNDQTVEVLREHQLLIQLREEVAELRAKLRSAEEKAKRLEQAVRESVAGLPAYANTEDWDAEAGTTLDSHELAKLVSLDDYEMALLKEAML